MRRITKITLGTIGGLAVLAIAGFGLLQSGRGKAWLADRAGSLSSSPGNTIEIGAVTGLVPFDMRVSRITLADRDGVWLAIDKARLSWSPLSLLTGRLRIGRLAADTIQVLHSPASSESSTAGGFTLPKLPFGVELQSFEIGRLVMDPSMAGQENAGARVSAKGLLGRGRADLNLRLTRIDDQPGFATLDAHYDQAADQLGLAFDLEEPTGILLDEALRRTDKLPLRVTVKGDGPLAGWKGRLALSMGDIAHAETAIEIAQTKGSRIALTGSAAIAALLPENIRPTVGDNVTFQIIAAEDGARGMMIAPSRIAMASMTLTASGARSDKGVLSGNAHFAIADMTAFAKTVGPASGEIDLDATLAGTVDHPLLNLAEKGRVVIGGIALDGLSAAARIEATGKTAAQGVNVDVAVDAKAETVRDAAEGGAVYGPLTIHAAGTADSSGKIVNIKEASASGAGVEFKGGGNMRDGAAQATASLNAADLSVMGKMLGQPIGGASAIDVKVETRADKTIALQLTGGGDRLRTGLPALDALLSGHMLLEANGTRGADGKITLSKFSLNGGRAKLDGDGGFNPADRTIDANVTGNLADLNALSGALQNPLAGTGSVSAKIGGTLDQPAIDAKVMLDRLAFGATRIDHLDVQIRAPRGLNGAATLNARIASGRLNQTIDAELRREGDQIYRLSKLTMAGTGGAMNGALLADLGKSRVSGKIDAIIGDLSIWSGVAGKPVSGKVTLAMDIPADANRQGPVTAAIDRFAYGSPRDSKGPGSIGIAHAGLNGRISGDFSRPNGSLDLVLSGVAASGGSLSNGDIHVVAQNMRADFRAHLAAQVREPGTVDVAGSFTKNRDADIVQLTALSAVSGAHKLSLTRPATITVGPQSYALADLALSADGGTIEGDAALNPRRVSADIKLRQFPLHPLAALSGKTAVGGTLDGRITLDGTSQQPRAKLSLVSKGLDMQMDGPLPRPALNLSIDADWQGDRANLNLKLASGTGEALSLTGSAPFAFDLVSLQPRRPSNPALALKLTGGGKIENLTSIVPLGEDRMTGAFTIDVAIGGTMDSPRPTGRIAVNGGNYANMALGTQLSGIDLALEGEGERFVLDHLTATDAATGKLNASGAIDLGVSPATVSFDLGFTDFLVARGDNATIDADGTLKLNGTTQDMKAAGKLTLRHAELYIPDRLPASVVNLDVTEIGGRQKAEDAPKSAPLAPIALQIAIDAPGQVFVRGHGVTSEWRGHTDIGGTTAGPVMVGQLSVVNGTIDLLGQTFNIDRGNVNFGGGRDIDPILDVQASATASGITADVNVTGTARAPKIALSSTPALPQDEILSRILFGENVGSLTPSQGLQLAQAAATMAQGGPGILDRVRSTIGLDRLDLTGGGSNSTGTQGAAKGTTVSGGKYIANGVFVGVAQGASTNSSQAKVEVEVTPHISVNSTFGTASGSGFGAKYSVDY